MENYKLKKSRNARDKVNDDNIQWSLWKKKKRQLLAKVFDKFMWNKCHVEFVWA